MDNKDSLEKLVAEVKTSIETREFALNNPSKKDSFFQPTSLTLLTTILLILVGFKLFYIEARDSAIIQDIEESALDLIMEADATVTQYFEFYGGLPELLPDPTLRAYVDYSSLDADNYTLKLHLDGYDQTVHVATGQTLSTEDVLRVLNLDRLN